MDSRIFSKQYGGGVVLLRQSEIVYLQVDDTLTYTPIRISIM